MMTITWNFLGGPLLLNNATSEANFWYEKFYVRTLKITLVLPHPFLVKLYVTPLPILIKTETTLVLHFIYDDLDRTWKTKKLNLKLSILFTVNPTMTQYYSREECAMYVQDIIYMNPNFLCASNNQY